MIRAQMPLSTEIPSWQHWHATPCDQTFVCCVNVCLVFTVLSNTLISTLCVSPVWWERGSVLSLLLQLRLLSPDKETQGGWKVSLLFVRGRQWAREENERKNEISAVLLWQCVVYYGITIILSMVEQYNYFSHDAFDQYNYFSHDAFVAQCNLLQNWGSVCRASWAHTERRQQASEKDVVGGSVHWKLSTHGIDICALFAG